MGGGLKGGMRKGGRRVGERAGREGVGVWLVGQVGEVKGGAWRQTGIWESLRGNGGIRAGGDGVVGVR